MNDVLRVLSLKPRDHPRFSTFRVDAFTERITSALKGMDHYSTLLMLLTEVGFVMTPFTVAVLADSIHHPQNLAAAVRLMSSVTLFSMVIFSGFVFYLVHHGLFRDDVDQTTIRVIKVICYTVWIWPLTSFALSSVSKPGSLVVLVVLVGYVLVCLWPIDPLTTEGNAERAWTGRLHNDRKTHPKNGWAFHMVGIPPTCRADSVGITSVGMTVCWFRT